ncbi:MAG TPA: phosphopyruvate hydratase [Candidatus Paceibacterota bacterium]
MPRINKIEAREILDSRGNPTLEVDCFVGDSPAGGMGRFSVPSGASTGKYEALEKRDNDLERFGGRGVKELALRIEDEITPMLLNKDFDQKSLDNFLIEKDGTPNKSNFGANVVLGLSMSFAKALAENTSLPFWKYIKNISGKAENDEVKMPTPMINIINGGIHADSGLDIQEFMIVPLKDESLAEKIRKSDEVFQNLKLVLGAMSLSVAVGDEGGFAPKVESHRRTLELIREAIRNAGFSLGEDFGIALDVAASQLLNSENDYFMKSENRHFNREELLEYYQSLTNDFPIVSIEDPFAEDDWEGNVAFTKKFGDKIIVVGDDLLVTNPRRLEEGIKKKAANAILIKLNQIGTLSETLEVIKMARGANWQTVISHRSGETEDTSIDHLAVGTNSSYIKTGSLSRGERTAKYNELLRIEESLKNL